MKKISVIATALLGAILIGAYVLLAGRQDSGAPADPGQVTSDAPAPPAEPSPGSAATGTAAVQPGAVEGESIASGAKTEFALFGGEIGYVDPVSVAQERNPYSVVALLQKHHAYTGADELLELEVESVGRTSGGHSAWLVQVIGEIPTPGRVNVNFESSGAVVRARGFLVDAKAAAPGNILILQAEAEAIALEAAARFVEARRAPLAARGIPLRMEASLPDLRYALNPEADNALRAEWKVWVGTYSPRDSLEVLVAADTGEVVSVRSVIEIRTSKGCTGLAVRVCDATTMTRNSKVSCGDGLIDGGKPVLEEGRCVAQEEEREKCSQARYTKAMDSAERIRDYVKSIGASTERDYLAGAGGLDCRIDILINVDSDLLSAPNAEGEYDPKNNVILVKEDHFNPRTGRMRQPAFDESLVAHEILHAVARGGGDVEHGLVSAMEALHMGGGDSNWGSGNKDFTKDQNIYGRDTHAVVGNAIYRIYKKMGAQHKDTVFRFALEVDRERPTSRHGFREAMVNVAKDMEHEELQEAVAIVLMDMGINELPTGVISITMQKFYAEKMLALFARGEEADNFAAAAAKAMEKWLRDLGYLDRNDVTK